MTSTEQMNRWKIVGWNHNAPDPFTGFGGKVGLGQDMALLDNGDWFVVFHAGYWHLSAATPFVADEKFINAWAGNGYPRDHIAPTGGRILSVRSSDQGRTWTRPQTVMQGQWDISPIGMNKLDDGSLLVFVNEQASWYGLDAAPPGHLPVNTRVGVIRSSDDGTTWSKPVWLEMPQPYYQRSYAQATTLQSGALLFPTYTTDRFDGKLQGAIHRSNDKGQTWHLVSTLTRNDDGAIDEPTLTTLQDGRLMLMTRLDAAIFYSEDEGVTWTFSHHAPFAPLKAHRTTVLSNGTVVCWMTSKGTLRVSWSHDHGKTWHTDNAGDAWSLDAQSYGYPGGCVLEDESIVAVYYDAANRQLRTNIWAIHFVIDPKKNALHVLSAPVKNNTDAASLADGEELDVDVMHKTGV